MTAHPLTFRARGMRVALVGGYVATMPVANWMIGHVGSCGEGPCVIPVGFGLMAPSGVLMIGAALVLRDMVQDAFGKLVALSAVVVGAILSFLTADPFIATASAVAFLVAEVSDFAIYTPLRERGRALAVAASGVVGAAVDSALFTLIAFGSLDLSLGTTLAKVYASAAVAVWLWVRRK